MTAPNHGGYTEGPEKIALRAEKRQAANLVAEFRLQTEGITPSWMTELDAMTDSTDPRIKQQRDILKSLSGDPVSLEVEGALTEELAALDVDLQRDPPESADWSEPSEEYKNSQPYHNDLYPYF